MSEMTCIEDLRVRAKKRVPQMFYEYADTLSTMRIFSIKDVAQALNDDANHGSRQLDGAISSIHPLPHVAKEVGTQMRYPTSPGER
jgi:hypothetical protein